MQVGHTRVEAGDLVLVRARHALIPQETDALVGALRRRDDHAALAGGHVLGRVEAEHGPLAEGADRSAVELGSVGLGGILEHGEAVLLRQGGEPPHVGGVTVEVDGHDRGGAGADRPGGRLGVEAEAVALDVGEHRRGSRKHYGVRRRSERERRDDDLVARPDPGGEQAEQQAGSAGVDRGSRQAAHQGFGELALEGAHFGTLGEHAAAQHRIHCGPLVVADQRPCSRDEVQVAHRTTSSVSSFWR
jgi:hypothetical protein